MRTLASQSILQSFEISMKRTPCSVCGFLHRFSAPLPVGRKAVCRNCSSEFVIEQAVETPDGVKFMALHVEGVGTTACVGESYYRENLRGLLRELNSNPENPIAFTKQTCTLIPETDNEHDPNAVRVEIAGFHLGYLSRRDAAIHRKYLVDSGKPLWRLKVDGMLLIHWKGSNTDPKIESFSLMLQVSWSDE